MGENESSRRFRANAPFGWAVHVTFSTKRPRRFRFALRDGWDPREYDRGFKDFLVAARPHLPVIVEVRNHGEV